MWRPSSDVFVNNDCYIRSKEIYKGQRVWYGCPEFTESLGKASGFINLGEYIISSIGSNGGYNLSPANDSFSGVNRCIFFFFFSYGIHNLFFRNREDAIKHWNLSISNLIEQIDEYIDTIINDITSIGDSYIRDLIRDKVFNTTESIISSTSVPESRSKYYFRVRRCLGINIPNYISRASGSDFIMERFINNGTYGNSIYTTCWSDSNSAKLGFLRIGMKESIEEAKNQKKICIKKIEKLYIK